jgi:hypothetical protein
MPGMTSRTGPSLASVMPVPVPVPVLGWAALGCLAGSEVLVHIHVVVLVQRLLRLPPQPLLSLQRARVPQVGHVEEGRGRRPAAHTAEPLAPQHLGGSTGRGLQDQVAGGALEGLKRTVLRVATATATGAAAGGAVGSAIGRGQPLESYTSRVRYKFGFTIFVRGKPIADGGSSFGKNCSSMANAGVSEEPNIHQHQ